jgi:diguanylate cyclase (GGDEF)-like protein
MTNLAVLVGDGPGDADGPAEPLRRHRDGGLCCSGWASACCSGRVLETCNRRAFALEREQHRDARTDALTGLHNRRAMQERGRAEVKGAMRAGVPVSVILCDIDHFKSINDQYGHEAATSRWCRRPACCARRCGKAMRSGRWGGEEFMAVLPGTDAIGAGQVAERMRAAIAATRFGSLAATATISLGVATSELVDDPGAGVGPAAEGCGPAPVSRQA